jgi:hypothetical protein
LADGGSASIPLQNETEMLKFGHLQLAAYKSQSTFLDAKEIEDASTVVQAQITELKTSNKKGPRGKIFFVKFIVGVLSFIFKRSRCSRYVEK